MTLDPAHIEHARKVADAILYEGYLLYPYYQSAQKNQHRFQFGVLMPPGYAAVDPQEPTASQTECLLECPDETELRILVRFLHLRRRIAVEFEAGTGEPREVDALQVDGTQYTSFDEAAEREQPAMAPVADLLAHDQQLEFHFGGGESAEDLRDASGQVAGRLVRRWNAVDGLIGVHAERVAGPYGVLRLRVRIENRTVADTVPRTRQEGLAHALIAAHVLIAAPGGRFLSMTDPPEWAAGAVAGCENTGTWPVRAGPPECQELVLSSPVILYDHPEIAAESPGDLFDATEIDEILTLRTLALTDTEKQQARATDPRAAGLMDRLDDMPPEMLERMHGAIRYLKSGPARPQAGPDAAGQAAEASWPAAPGTEVPATPWWDPGSDASVSPETDHVVIGGAAVRRGSRVRMRPGSRRADAQDLFLAGRLAVVEAVLHDVDGQVHLAVTPEDDPAADLQRSHGRFLYFAPDELELLDSAAAPPQAGGQSPAQNQALDKQAPGEHQAPAGRQARREGGEK
ncbi:MAG: hypothetical protein ACLPUO_08185 [Streptosporangiaceae bacterium]